MIPPSCCVVQRALGDARVEAIGETTQLGGARD